MPVCAFQRKDGTYVKFMTHPDSTIKKSGKNNCVPSTVKQASTINVKHAKCRCPKIRNKGHLN